MAAADRTLLFGLLALQNGLIDQDQLVDAFRAWTRDKARPMADHLVGRSRTSAGRDVQRSAGGRPGRDLDRDARQRGLRELHGHGRAAAW